MVVFITYLQWIYVSQLGASTAEVAARFQARSLSSCHRPAPLRGVGARMRPPAAGLHQAPDHSRICHLPYRQMVSGKGGSSPPAGEPLPSHPQACTKPYTSHLLRCYSHVDAINMGATPE